MSHNIHRIVFFIETNSQKAFNSVKLFIRIGGIYIVQRNMCVCVHSCKRVSINQCDLLTEMVGWRIYLTPSVHTPVT